MHLKYANNATLQFFFEYNVVHFIWRLEDIGCLVHEPVVITSTTSIMNDVTTRIRGPSLVLIVDNGVI